MLMFTAHWRTQNETWARTYRQMADSRFTLRFNKADN
jgi:hypothetical protein